MPFTFSHPAIILPVAYLPKKWYSLSGLIIGSITPDFEYFMRMKDYSRYSHTWTGLFWFDIPLGFFLLFIFHNVVRNVLIEHLPFSVNIRLSTFENFTWNRHFRKNAVIVTISLIVGIASHLFWDSFTHEGEYFAQAMPLLRNRVYILNHAVTGARLFQYISSFFGGLVMLILIFKLPERYNTKRNNILNFWLIVGLVTVSIVTLRLYLDTLLNHHDHEDIIVTTISGILIGITSLSFVLMQRKKYKVNNTIKRIQDKEK